MKIKMTRGKVRDLGGAVVGIINRSDGLLPGRFNYSLNKTYALLKHELEALKKYDDAQLKEYIKEQRVVLEKYCKKDKDKKPILKKGNFDFDPAVSDDLTKDLKALEEKFSKELEEQKNFYEEEVEIDYYAIQQLDQAQITAFEMNQLLLIEVKEESKKE
jgi:hypothetical protein